VLIIPASVPSIRLDRLASSCGIVLP